MTLTVNPPSDQALLVAEQAFLGLQRGAATGDWTSFADLLTDDVRIMIPVPAGEPNPPEGLLRGKEMATQLFATHHGSTVEAVRLECHRVTANGPLVILECRVEGTLNGAQSANHFVFALEVRGHQIAAMYEYATWTAKNDDSAWGREDFAREAFPTTLIPLDQSLLT